MLAPGRGPHARQPRRRRTIAAADLGDLDRPAGALERRGRARPPAAAGRRPPRAGRGRPRGRRSRAPARARGRRSARAIPASRPSESHQLVPAPQLRRLVAVERDVQRAELEHADVAPGGLGELGGEPRPERGARRARARAADPRPRSPRRPAPASRRRRRRRRRPARLRSITVTSRPRLAARQAQARPITPPPTTIASALGVVGAVCATGAAPFPGGRTFASPCAGITRIRFRRSAARRRPLSPFRSGSRCSSRYSPMVASFETRPDASASSPPSRPAISTRALALTTDDVVLDRSHSKGPFRGVARGHDEVRAATAEYRDPIGGMTWEPRRVRDRRPGPRRGRDRGLDRGPLERHQRDRPRRLAGALRGRADRRGRAPPELRRGAAGGAAAGARRRPPVLRLRGAAATATDPGRCSRRRSPAGST